MSARNIYKAKRLDSGEIVEGQHLFYTNPEWITHNTHLLQFESFEHNGMAIDVEIEPSTLEVVRLDLNDEQKKELLIRAGERLESIQYSISRSIESVHNGDFTQYSDFTCIENAMEINLNRLKKVNKLLQGII